MADNAAEEPRAPTWYDEWRGRTPVVSRWVLITVLVCAVAFWLLGLSMLFTNCAFMTVMKLQVWRLVTGLVTTGGLLSLVFSVFIFGSMGPKRERQMGSIPFLLMLLALGLMTQLGYAVAVLLLAFNPIWPMPSLFMSCASGFGAVWLSMLAVECAENPEAERKFPCLPFKMKNKYYPFVLVAIFSLLFSFQVDSFVALGVGFLYTWGYTDFAIPSPERITSLEEGRLAALARQEGFVALADAGAPAPVPGAPPAAGGGGGGGGGSGWVSSSGGDVFGRGGGANGNTAGGAQGPGGRGEPDAFPGSGNTLGDAPGTSSAPSSSSNTSNDGGKGGKGGKGRRNDDLLNALAARLGGGTEYASQAKQLVEMGFEHEAAVNALQQSGGDMEAAAQLLASNTV